MKARPGFWGGLIVALTLLYNSEVMAQGRVELLDQPAGPSFQLANPPAHVQKCLEEIANGGQYVTIRKAGVTHEEAQVTFTASMKLLRYMATLPQTPPHVKNTDFDAHEALMRGYMEMVYSWDDEIIENDDLWRAILNEKLQQCIEANAPAE